MLGVRAAIGMSSTGNGLRREAIRERVHQLTLNLTPGASFDLGYL
jgi:hypothetical protein